MAFDNMNMDDLEPDMEQPIEETPPEEQKNRTFIIIAAIIGAVLLLVMIVGGIYALFILPGQQEGGGQSAQQTNDAVQSTNLALMVQATQAAMTEEASILNQQATLTQVALNAKITSTATTGAVLAPTSTQVINRAVTDTPSGTSLVPDRTATVSALLTEAALKKNTTVPTTTALPTTGFMDEIGLPGMLGLAVVLVVIIFLARRLRSA
jgi:hypothetical protein